MLVKRNNRLFLKDYFKDFDYSELPETIPYDQLEDPDNGDYSQVIALQFKEYIVKSQMSNQKRIMKLKQRLENILGSS